MGPFEKFHPDLVSLQSKPHFFSSCSRLFTTDSKRTFKTWQEPAQPLGLQAGPLLKAAALQNRTTCIKGKRTHSLCRAGLGALKTESAVLILFSCYRCLKAQGCLSDCVWNGHLLLLRKGKVWNPSFDMQTCVYSGEGCCDRCCGQVPILCFFTLVSLFHRYPKRV